MPAPHIESALKAEWRLMPGRPPRHPSVHEGRTLQTVGFRTACLRLDKALFPYRLILFVACAAE